MMRSFQPENCTNLIQLKVTDRKWNQSYNSDSNQELGSPNMKLNETDMNTKTIAGSMQKILMSSLKQTTGFMVTSHIPTSLENQANPHKHDLKEKKHSDKSMKKDSKSWKESTLTIRNQNSLYKLCFPLILIIILTEVQDTSELYPEREIMCTLIYDFPPYYFKKEECNEVTYRVYSFVTTSQGYPHILSYDLNKHVSWLSDHVIMESHGIH